MTLVRSGRAFVELLSQTVFTPFLEPLSSGMTWYAKELIVSAFPTALEAIESNPSIKNSLFRLRGPIDYKWYRPEHKHDYSDSGLLVIRPICSKASHAFEWLASDERVLLPEKMKPLNNISLNINLSKVEAALGFQTDELYHDGLLDVLHFAKALSQKIQSTVSYYDVLFWGGEPEYELAWIFNDGEEEVLIKGRDDLEGGLVKIFTSKTESTIDCNILQYTLSKHGCNLASGFFLPHSREFPWRDHKIK